MSKNNDSLIKKQGESLIFGNCWRFLKGLEPRGSEERVNNRQVKVNKDFRVFFFGQEKMMHGIIILFTRLTVGQFRTSFGTFFGPMLFFTNNLARGQTLSMGLFRLRLS